MIRLFCWRLGLSYWSCLKKLGFRFGEEWMFSYGANVGKDVLTEKRKIVPLKELPFVLRDFELVFNQPGIFKGMGFADILQKSGARVPGILYKVHWIDAKIMDYFELGHFMRKHKRIHVRQDGHDFFTYQVLHPKSEPLVPTEEYLGRIIEAASQNPEVTQPELDQLKNTPVLQTYEPAQDINFVILDYAIFGSFFAPVLKAYDRLAVLIFTKILYPYQIKKPGEQSGPSK